MIPPYGFFDDAASQKSVALVKHERLTWGDSLRWILRCDDEVVTSVEGEGASHGTTAVSELGKMRPVPFWIGHEPIRSRALYFRNIQIFPLAYDNLVRRFVNGDDKPGTAGQAQAFSLPNRISKEPSVSTKRPSVEGDDFSIGHL